MKLDPDLIRAILLLVEGAETREYQAEIQIDGYDRWLVAYHVELLNEDGFLSGHAVWDSASPGGGPIYVDNRLKMKGHEFLNTIRGRSNWEKTKAVAEKAGVGSLAGLYDIGKHVAAAAIQAAIGLS